MVGDIGRNALAVIKTLIAKALRFVYPTAFIICPNKCVAFTIKIPCFICGDIVVIVVGINHGITKIFNRRCTDAAIRIPIAHLCRISAVALNLVAIVLYCIVENTRGHFIANNNVNEAVSIGIEGAVKRAVLISSKIEELAALLCKVSYVLCNQCLCKRNRIFIAKVQTTDITRKCSRDAQF